MKNGEKTKAKATNLEESDEAITGQEVHSNLQAVKEQMEDDNNIDIGYLKNALEEKEEESREYYDRLLRLQADFTNFKKRVEKEKSDIYLYANEKLALDLLDIMDNLERAIVSQGEDKENPLYTGIQLIFKQLLDVLNKHGIKEIEALNKPFDMNLHHAVMREEADAESGEVIEVFQKGYTIQEKVLRPAMVKVAE